MPPAIALIRGINVGSTRPLRMALLRELCQQVGMHNPQTLIQSGNLVFQAPARALASLATKLEAAIEKRQGFRPTVILRTLEDFSAAIAANPFAVRAKAEPNKLLVMFLAGPARPGAAAALAALKRDREQIKLNGSEVYLDYPDGVGRSRLSMASIETASGGPGTARNWNTVLKLLALANDPEA